MTDREFWDLIDASLAATAGQVDCREQATFLREALVQRGSADCLDFHRLLRQHIEALHTFDMKAASLLVFHGIEPETFRNFRAWLVCRGQEKYSAVKQDVSSIATLLAYDEVETLDGGLLLQVAEAAFEELGGFEDEFYAAIGNHPEPHFEQDWPDDWAGMSARWPLLYKRFCAPSAPGQVIRPGRV